MLGEVEAPDGRGATKGGRETPCSRGEPPKGSLGCWERSRPQTGEGPPKGVGKTPSGRGEPPGGSLGLLGEVEAPDERGAPGGAAKGVRENA